MIAINREEKTARNLAELNITQYIYDKKIEEKKIVS
jgi:hypothetical protein